MWLPNWLVVFRDLSLRTRFSSIPARRRRQSRRIVAAERLELRLCLSAAPEVASLGLQNDTGEDGDLSSQDPTLAGTLSNDGGFDYVDVEFDLDGDGYTDGWVSPESDGSFVYDPSGEILPGEITIHVRAGEYTMTGYQYGAWESITFTYEDPAGDPPDVTSVSLQNDTGEDGDSATTDPALTGTLSNEGGFDYVDVEFDLDGDGYTDSWVSPESDGSFEYDPSGEIQPGEITIYVRAGEYTMTGYQYGDWVSITFTFEDPS